MSCEWNGLRFLGVDRVLVKPAPPKLDGGEWNAAEGETDRLTDLVGSSACRRGEAGIS
jgi:hypothetical protein